MKKQAESNVGNDATVQSPPSVMETSSATDTTTELIKSLPTIVVLNVEPAGEFWAFVYIVWRHLLLRHIVQSWLSYITSMI